MNTISKGLSLGILLLIVVLFYKLGFFKKKSKEEKKQQKIIEEGLTKVLQAEKKVNMYTYLNPDLHKTADPRSLITKEKALGYAKRLDKALNSWFPFGDDEEEIYLIFREIPNGINVSQVAELYNEISGRGLRESLVSDLDGVELSTVYDILKRK